VPKDSGLASDVTTAQQRRTELLARVLTLETEIAELTARKKEIANNASNREASFLRSPECEKHLRHFIDSNIVPVVRCNIYGDILELNDATVRLLGYEREEFLSGKIKWTDITPPEYIETDETAIAQVKAFGPVTPFEKAFIRKDKTRVPVLCLVSVADPTGDDCLSFMLDLTDKKQAEAQLKASESQFRLLAEAIPQIVWISNLDGKTLYCNQRFYELLGLQRADDDGYLWFKALHPDDRRKFFVHAKEVQRQKGTLEIKGRLRLKSGAYHWSLFRAIPMTDLHSQEIRWFGTCTDIEQQMQTEATIRKSELKFRTLADAIPQIVWTANPDGQIDFFNHRWFEYTGLTLEQSQTEGWQLLIHPDDMDKYMREWRKAIMTGDTYEMEFRLKRAVGLGKSKGNPYRWHLGRAVALRGSDGSVVKWFATWTEIESQKR
jgi:PAS domain S-box-containing protein